MSAPIERAGFELALARYLVLRPCYVRLLMVLLDGAGAPVSITALSNAGADDGGPPIPRRHVRMYVSPINLALEDVGLPRAELSGPTLGYELSHAAAADIRARIAQELGSDEDLRRAGRAAFLGRLLKLTPCYVRLLTAFIEHQGRPLTAVALAQLIAVPGQYGGPAPKGVRTYITTANRGLARLGLQGVELAGRGVGYFLPSSTAAALLEVAA